MARHSPIYGFPSDAPGRIRFRGKQYRISMSDVRALNLLTLIYEHKPDSGDTSWLLPLRGYIREIERINPRAALNLVVGITDDERLRCLAIWLRGRCGGTSGATIVSSYRTSSNQTLRKEVARSLKRLDGWAELRKMARTDPDPRIRRMAVQPSPEPYANRLASFVRHAPRLMVTPRKSPLIVAPGLDLTAGRPPKPRWLIRFILERIHLVVTDKSG